MTTRDGAGDGLGRDPSPPWASGVTRPRPFGRPPGSSNRTDGGTSDELIRTIPNSTASGNSGVSGKGPSGHLRQRHDRYPLSGVDREDAEPDDGPGRLVPE